MKRKMITVYSIIVLMVICICLSGCEDKDVKKTKEYVSSTMSSYGLTDYSIELSGITCDIICKDIEKLSNNDKMSLLKQIKKLEDLPLDGQSSSVDFSYTFIKVNESFGYIYKSESEILAAKSIAPSSGFTEPGLYYKDDIKDEYELLLEDEDWLDFY